MKSLVDSIYEDWRRYNKKNLPTSCNEFYVMWTAKISNEDGLVSWDNGMVKNSFYVDQYLLRVLSTNKIKTILKEEFEKKYSEKVREYVFKANSDATVTVYIDVILGCEIASKPKYSITYTKCSKMSTEPYAIEMDTPNEIKQAQKKADVLKEEDEKKRIEKEAKRQADHEKYLKDKEEWDALMEKVYGLEDLGWENASNFPVDRIQGLNDIKSISMGRCDTLYYSLTGGVRWRTDSSD